MKSYWRWVSCVGLSCLLVTNAAVIQLLENGKNKRKIIIKNAKCKPSCWSFCVSEKHPLSEAKHDSARLRNFTKPVVINNWWESKAFIYLLRLHTPKHFPLSHLLHHHHRHHLLNHQLLHNIYWNITLFVCFNKLLTSWTSTSGLVFILSNTSLLCKLLDFTLVLHFSLALFPFLVSLFCLSYPFSVFFFSFLFSLLFSCPVWAMFFFKVLSIHEPHYLLFILPLDVKS